MARSPERRRRRAGQLVNDDQAPAGSRIFNPGISGDFRDGILQNPGIPGFFGTGLA